MGAGDQAGQAPGVLPSVGKPLYWVAMALVVASIVFTCPTRS